MDGERPLPTCGKAAECGRQITTKGRTMKVPNDRIGNTGRARAPKPGERFKQWDVCFRLWISRDGDGEQITFHRIMHFFAPVNADTVSVALGDDFNRLGLDVDILTAGGVDK